MSFEIGPAPGTPRRPPAARGGFLLLILFGVVAFFIVQAIRSRMTEPQQVVPADRPATNSRDRDVGDREITIRPPASTEPRAPSITKKGDWSIEEVDVKPSSASDSDVTLTVPTSADAAENGAATPKAAPKKTTKGDWSIEELEGQKTPNK
jgi:hypothetical protein